MLAIWYNKHMVREWPEPKSEERKKMEASPVVLALYIVSEFFDGEATQHSTIYTSVEKARKAIIDDVCETFEGDFTEEEIAERVAGAWTEVSEGRYSFFLDENDTEYTIVRITKIL